MRSFHDSGSALSDQELVRAESRARTQDEQLGLGLTPQPSPPVAKRRSFHVKGGFPTAQEAHEGEARAKRQEELVLAFLREHPAQRFVPHEIGQAIGIARTNSVSRSLTNLKTAELVLKHPSDRRLGEWGVPVCTWSAA